jgi:hypothetical protein
MPDVVGVTIRRHHVYAAVPVIVRCPDCGARLLDVVERVEGGIEKACRSCRDANGEKKHFVIIFHTDLDSYREAIARESQKIDIVKES